MTRNQWLKLGIFLTFIVTLGGFLITGPTQAQRNTPQSPALTTSTLDTAFTYQGRLTDGGSPANGAYDFQFTLYDAASGGSAVGSTVDEGDVTVTDGLFTVELDFGSVFDGAAVWLDIAVRPGSSTGAYTALSPRQAITAAPYALSLQPGAVIQGDAGYSALSVINTAASGPALGVLGRTYSPDGNGVSGIAEAASGTSIGAYGRSSGSSGYGVYGWADSATGLNYGVYGRSSSPAGYGVYSNGNAHVEGQLTWKPITGQVSIPSASFRPEDSSATYTSAAGWLKNTTLTSQIFAAGVQLPDQAVVTKLTFYWKDTSASDGSVSLVRNTFDQSATEMAAASTSGSSGNGSSSDTSIFNATIDNAQYAYLLRATLPPLTTVYLQGVVIEYTIDRPY